MAPAGSRACNRDSPSSGGRLLRQVSIIQPTPTEHRGRWQPSRCGAASRQDLTDLARAGSIVHRPIALANALLFRTRNTSCGAITGVVLLDDVPSGPGITRIRMGATEHAREGRQTRRSPCRTPAAANAKRLPGCPPLDPTERLCEPMHKPVTHNGSQATFADLTPMILTRPREQVPRQWDAHHK